MVWVKFAVGWAQKVQFVFAFAVFLVSGEFCCFCYLIFICSFLFVLSVGGAYWFCLTLWVCCLFGFCFGLWLVFALGFVWCFA